MKGLSRPVILVVDADVNSSNITAMTLASREYEVLTSANAQDALRAAKSADLDLIVCDVNLQGQDGVALCKELRQVPNCSDVPVMFLSTNQLPSVASRMFQNGSALFLKKPFSAPLFLDLVEKALWMPHLIKSHEHRPHITLANFPVQNPANAVFQE